MRPPACAVPLGLIVAVLFARPGDAASLDDARTLHARGELAAALEGYREVAADPDADATDVAVAHNNSCVILTNRGEHRAAIGECREALKIRRQLDDERRLGRTLNNLGLALQNLGSYDEALTRFEEALAINRRLEDAEAEVINLANLGGLSTLAGQYDRAVRYLEAATERTAYHADEPWAPLQLRITRANRGVVLEKLGAFREALDIYREILDEGDELDPWQRASFRVNTAVLYRNLGDPVRALAELDAAADAYRSLGYRPGLSNALLNTGIVRHLDLGDPEGAEVAYREALSLSEEARDQSEIIQDLFYLGRLLTEQERLAEAESLFERCLAAAEESGSREGQWSALEGLGEVARRVGELEEAIAYLERAIAQIEEVRSELEPGEARTGYFGDKRSVFAKAVRVLADLHKRQPEAGHWRRALQVVQQAKVRDLLDALGSEAPSISPMTVSGLEERVGRGTLLELFAGEERLFRWTVHDGSTRLDDLGDAQRVLQAAREIHRAAAASEPLPADRINELSSVLLDGVSLPKPGHRLWVSADGALRLVPFELLSPPSHPSVPLVEAATVAYLPSAAMLDGLLAAQRPRSGRLVGLGAPVLPRSAEDGFSLGTVASRFRLRPLPGATRELASLQRWLRGEAEIRTGAAATEAGLREAVGDGVDLLHLATHAVLEDRLGAGPTILLTPDADDDGLLRPEEIAALALPARLTVLAACSTALGPWDDGAALTTLTGAFLAAGASAVVASLWEVGDAATAVFMEQLYYELGRGREPAEAVRSAKLRLRSDPEWNRPAVWSAFVLVGAGQGVGAQPRYAAWLVGGVAAALALWWGLAGRKRRRTGAPGRP